MTQSPDLMRRSAPPGCVPATNGLMTAFTTLLLASSLACGLLPPDVGTEWVQEGPVEVAILCESREIHPLDDYWMTVTVRHPAGVTVDWSNASLDTENAFLDKFELGDVVSQG